MSPTKRDILKLPAGTVVAALTVRAVGSQTVEPVAAAPDPVTWAMNMPVSLEASDGRIICFMPRETYTLVHRYDFLGAPDHETIVIEGEEAERLYNSFKALASGMVAGLGLQ